MDSITQIVLGAAVGEVAMGRKLGNRAMVWGAIAGTIPDLDVLANFVVDDIAALAFHRAISHSFFFAFTAPALLAYFTARFYKSGAYQNKIYKWVVASIWVLLVGVVLLGINYIPYNKVGSVNPWLFSASAIGIAGLVYLLLKKYVLAQLEEVDLTWREWYWLFFWSIFTHPLLDSCTTYGTQLFQPFSDYRVALNNVSVADPFYTVPFLICLLVARFLTRGSKARKWVNWAGIIISSAYLLWTVYNKFKVNAVFEKSLKKQGLVYSRYTTSPTILNNFLWTCTAEGDTKFYQGFYSIFDEKPEVEEFNIIPKNHALVKDYQNDEDFKTLRWFSKDYYAIIRRRDGELQYNDLRFGIANIEAKGDESDYIFGFILTEDDDGNLHVEEDRSAREQDMTGRFTDLINRILGD